MYEAKFEEIKKQFPEVLKEQLGIISFACKKLGISRTTYFNWRKNDKDFRKKCKEASEVTGDYVEGKLLQLIDKMNPAAIIFYCKTKLKHRGYVERIEQTGKDGKPIETRQIISETDQAILDNYVKQRTHKFIPPQLDMEKVN